MSYGSLPPETRAQQARLFNDPDNDYDFLVASDAIGMGLNLFVRPTRRFENDLLTSSRSIKRVIFESVRKHDGAKIRQLSVSNIKQIAGRAGRLSRHQTRGNSCISLRLLRFLHQNTSSEELPPIPLALGSLLPISSPNDQEFTYPARPMPPGRLQEKSSNVGLIATLEKADFPIVKRAMECDAPPLTTAGILPTESIIKRFAKYFLPGTPFSYVLLRLSEIAQVSSRFHICNLKDKLILADAIHHVKNLTIEDRLLLCLVPVNVVKERHVQNYLVDLATAVSEQKGGGLLELLHLDLEVLDEVRGDRDYLRRVERLHEMLVAYLWLSFRFPGVFTTRPLAMHVKELVENAIAKSLSMFNFSEAVGKKRRWLEREKELLDLLQRDMLEQEQLRVERAKRRVELELRETSEQTLEEAKAAANELSEEEDLDGKDSKEVEGILSDARTFMVDA